MTYDPRTASPMALAFGPFRFLPTHRTLLRADQRLRLGSRAREILVLLVERAGEVVTKRELLARVWPDTVVEEGTLRVHIAAIRRTLGVDAFGLPYVENVTGRGYRLVTPVRVVPGAQPAPQASTLDPPRRSGQQ